MRIYNPFKRIRELNHKIEMLEYECERLSEEVRFVEENAWREARREHEMKTKFLQSSYDHLLKRMVDIESLTVRPMMIIPNQTRRDAQ